MTRSLFLSRFLFHRSAVSISAFLTSCPSPQRLPACSRVSLCNASPCLPSIFIPGIFSFLFSLSQIFTLSWNCALSSILSKLLWFPFVSVSLLPPLLPSSSSSLSLSISLLLNKLFVFVLSFPLLFLTCYLHCDRPNDRKRRLFLNQATPRAPSLRASNLAFCAGQLSSRTRIIRSSCARASRCILHKLFYFKHRLLCLFPRI